MDNQLGCAGGLAIIIFGVTGDLTTRKLMPALYENAKYGRLPENLNIIGFARRNWNIDQMKDSLINGIGQYARTKPVDFEEADRLLSKSHYIQSTFEDLNGYFALAKKLKQLEVRNVIFYLATPPDSYIKIVKNIGASNMQYCEDGWRRIVIEKPFGNDLDSAKILDHEIHKVFVEDQIYRMDHYLGKETVQNLLAFRFGNGIFEPLWNRNYIDHVQITVAENYGVGSRAGFYESAGVVRDVFQNHLLQLLSLMAMEAPSAYNALAVRDEKVKVLNSLHQMTPKEVLSNTFRAQYSAGLLDGEEVIGYKDENGVSSNSVTETYMAARLFVNNWRWAGVPFYIRSGKRMPKRLTQIVIQYTQLPLSLFGDKNFAGNAPNLLIFDIQPDEGISLFLGAKAPGPIHEIQSVKMRFNYKETFGGEPPEAYERLLLDCISGDATLFTRTDEVESAWKFTDGIISAWQQQELKVLPEYPAGSWGPIGADTFIEKDGRIWRQG